MQYFYCSDTTYLSILDTIFFNEIQRTSIVIIKILYSVSKVKNKVKKAETKKARVKKEDKCGKKDYTSFTRMKLIYLEIILIRHVVMNPATIYWIHIPVYPYWISNIEWKLNINRQTKKFV